MKQGEGRGEEERGRWKGISSRAFTLGVFVLEEERALHNDFTRHLRDKEGSAMFMSTEPCTILLMSLVFFERAAERLEDFWMWCQEQQARRQLCARGGGSAQRIKDGW
ncbi:unnamed protein product [Pleuronectes platessa]|uniref:Uncharacterized protein n=1 Tax=Pleuronectes platessa TaxID=8262 RepID=A0A9N7UMA4_PLEPL|nr:unnamed protein product [Pleuronectes platessa]